MKRLFFILLLVTIFLSIGSTTVSFGQEQTTGMTRTEIKIHFKVKELKGINSSFDDFSPSLHEGKIIFTSDRDFNYLNLGEEKWKKRKFLNVFEAELKTPTSDSIVETNLPKLFTSQWVHTNHSGPVCFSKDGETAILTYVKKEKGKTNKPQLYISKKKNGNWSSPQPLPFCNKEFSFGHPYFSSDNKTLYFSSDQPGGFGGKDIYSVEMLADNNWSAPVNIGEKINTSFNEVFPTLFGKELYFSSDRSEGFGKLDLYVFRGETRKEAKHLDSTINSEHDDFGLYFSPDKKIAFFSSNRNGQDDVFLADVFEEIIVYRDLAGRFSYRTLKEAGSGLEVLLIDDEGNILLRTKTDSTGQFVFRNLPMDKDVHLRTISDAGDLTLEILNEKGEVVAVLVRNQNGDFVYRELPLAGNSHLSIIEVEDTPLGKKGIINGQFIFDHLANAYPELEVLAVDDEGNIIARTRTDARGNFEFKNLPYDKNIYLVARDAGDQTTLIIYTKEGNVLAEFKADGEGRFVYRRLEEGKGGFLSLIEDINDTTLIPSRTLMLNGQFNYRELKGSPSNLSFLVMDENGNILHKGVSDKNGFFRLKNLPLVEQYLFHVDASDENFKKPLLLRLIDRNGKVLASLDNDKEGKFVYHRLKEEFVTINEKTASDTGLLVQSPKDLGQKTNGKQKGTSGDKNLTSAGQEFKVYFEKEEFTLSVEYKSEIRKIADLMKKDPSLKCTIEAHTDQRGSKEFNKALAYKRMRSVKNELANNGISFSRIKGLAVGEEKPMVNCTEQDCSEDDFLKNRRTVIILH